MRRELLLLREMRDAATEIRDLVGDRGVEQIETDRMRRSALLWHFTVIGEAASRVPGPSKNAHPEIAWNAATRLRNRIVHGYWDIDVETLATTATDDLPQMITQLESVIAFLTDLEETNDSGCPDESTAHRQIPAFRTRCRDGGRG